MVTWTTGDLESLLQAGAEAMAGRPSPLESASPFPAELLGAADAALARAAEICGAPTAEANGLWFSASRVFLVLVASILSTGAADLSAMGTGSITISLAVKSTLPIGAGLGSSAAYAVSCAAVLLRACAEALGGLDGLLDSSANVPAPGFADLISAWSYEAEVLVHGRPSGIDNAIATRGSALHFRAGEIKMLGPTALPPFRFLITNTKVPRNTKALVAGVRERRDRFPAIIDPILTAMHEVCTAFFALLGDDSGAATGTGSGDAATIPPTELEGAVLELIEVNEALLEALGVGHTAIRKVCDISASHGLVSKLTGAGGGGCVLTLVPSATGEDEISNLCAELDGAGFDSFEVTINAVGVCFE